MSESEYHKEAVRKLTEAGIPFADADMAVSLSIVAAKKAIQEMLKHCNLAVDSDTRILAMAMGTIELAMWADNKTDAALTVVQAMGLKHRLKLKVDSKG